MLRASAGVGSVEGCSMLVRGQSFEFCVFSQQERKSSFSRVGSLYEGLNPVLQALQLHIAVLGD